MESEGERSEGENEGYLPFAIAAKAADVMHPSLLTHLGALKGYRWMGNAGKGEKMDENNLSEMKKKNMER